MNESNHKTQSNPAPVIIKDGLLSTEDAATLRFRILISSPAGWQVYEVNPDRSRLVVGSDAESCDVVVQDVNVDDVQIIINLIEGQWQAIVRGNLESTLVNGLRLRQIALTQNNSVAFRVGGATMIMNFVNLGTADVPHAFRSRIIGGKGYVILNDNLPNDYSLRKGVLIGSDDLCDLNVGTPPFGAIVSFYRGRLFFHVLDDELRPETEASAEKVDSAVLLRSNAKVKIGGTLLKFVYSFDQSRDLSAEPDLCVSQINEEAKKEIVVLPEPGVSVTMGRAPDNDYVIESSHISRHHAKLTVLETGAKVEDNGSRNGVYVNGDKIESMTARPGDVIEMGNHRFLLCYDEN